MRRDDWLSVLLTIILLGFVAFLATVFAGGSLTSYLVVAFLAWLLSLGARRAFRLDGARYAATQAAIREGRTDVAYLEATQGSGGPQPGA